jgi:RNA polymerase sigma-70 factor (ECF subfamily)
MTDDPDIETQFVKHIVAGDTNALERFYEQYADSLYAYIYHWSGGVKEDAEDIWQESLLAAIRGLDAFQGQSRLFTWLCAIARRKTADHFRRLGRSVEALSVELVEDMPELIDRAPLPEAWVQAKTTCMHVVTVLQALPDDYRQALVARYAHEKSVKDIARLLGKSYKATESILSRARSAFKDAFTKTNGES